MTRSYCDCLCPMCIGQGKGSEGGRRYYPTEECASNARAIQMVTRHRCGLRIHFQDHASNIGSNTNRFFLQPATFPCPFPMDKHILAHPSYRQQPAPILSACFCPESLSLWTHILLPRISLPLCTHSLFIASFALFVISKVGPSFAPSSVGPCAR